MSSLFFFLTDILVNWEGCMGCGPTNVNTPRLAGIGGVLRNIKGKVLFMFSKYFGVCDSYEAEVLAILEALWCFLRIFRGSLIVESGSSNGIAWVSTQKGNL